MVHDSAQLLQLLQRNLTRLVQVADQQPEILLLTGAQRLAEVAGELTPYLEKEGLEVAPVADWELMQGPLHQLVQRRRQQERRGESDACEGGQQQ